MSYNIPQPNQVFQVSNFDGTTLNNSKGIFKVPSGVRFYASAIIFELTSVADFVDVPSISLGSESSYNDILPATALTGVSTANNILQFTLKDVISRIASGTDIGVKVTTAASATTYTLKCILLGALA